MAEFRNERDMVGMRLGPPPDIPGNEGFAAMGKPVPMHRKQNAYQHCKDMGMRNRQNIYDCVALMANKLERDEPYEAMAAGMRYLDLTGTYRLMAVLLTGAARTPEPAPETQYWMNDV